MNFHKIISALYHSNFEGKQKLSIFRKFLKFVYFLIIIKFVRQRFFSNLELNIEGKFWAPFKIITHFEKVRFLKCLMIWHLNTCLILINRNFVRKSNISNCAGFLIQLFLLGRKSPAELLLSVCRKDELTSDARLK